MHCVCSEYLFLCDFSQCMSNLWLKYFFDFWLKCLR